MLNETKEGQYNMDIFNKCLKQDDHVECRSRTLQECRNVAHIGKTGQLMYFRQWKLKEVLRM